MRIFIAALLPDEVRIRAGDYLNSLKSKVEGVKWEKPEKLHVTLKFLGETDEAHSSKVTETLERLSESYSPFRTKILRFGGFPGLENPRVLYLGLERNDELSAFQSELESALEPLGFPQENRRFIPHVTIGRVKKSFRTKGPVPIPEKIEFDISRIGVIKSELRPEGSVYTPLKIFELED